MKEFGNWRENKKRHIRLSTLISKSGSGKKLQKLEGIIKNRRCANKVESE